MRSLQDKRIVVTGGTGSLGRALVRRLITGEMGLPRSIVVFSRDEAKQNDMRLEYLGRAAATDDVIYRNSQDLLSFRIGDVRDYPAVAAVLQEADVVFNAAALKQVPACEYFPFEAVNTNILGPQNIVRAIRETAHQVELVVAISTDKACKPVNVMGMTKAIQERLFVQANLECQGTRFVCVRYGNVISSRGSVIPLFIDQIRGGGPVTITLREMTRFLLSLDAAVDTVFAAVRSAGAGETYVPRVPSARIVDVAEVLIGGRNIEVSFEGIRPGEKVHEILVSEEECHRTADCGDYYAIWPILPELRRGPLGPPAFAGEYSSASSPVGLEDLRQLLVGPLRQINAR